MAYYARRVTGYIRRAEVQNIMGEYEEHLIGLLVESVYSKKKKQIKVLASNLLGCGLIWI